MKILLAFLLAAAVVVAVTAQKVTTANKTPSAFFPIAIAQPKPEETTVNHPDGTKKFMMTMTKTSEGRTYTFVVADGMGENKRQLFTKTVSEESSLTIPYNTFSPGAGTYVFIEENGPDGKHILVLKTSGETFTGGEQYLDVGSLFGEKKYKYTFGHATGWASPTLLIFTSINENGVKGPNWWFELPSRAFLQLAS